MAKKKKDKEPQKKVEVKEEAAVTEEDVACPVCGKPVGAEVTACPYCGAEFESEEEVVEEAVEPTRELPAVEPTVAPAAEPEGETAECPVCGKPVGLDVASCPHCGAEFEEEEVEEVAEEVVEEPEEVGGLVTPAKGAPVSEEETAECPVCGKNVGLDLTTCPFCGAEFEEEEVEEVIEVEEKPAPAAALEAPTEEPEQAEEVVEVSEEAEVPSFSPAAILDLRVWGVSLIILGIIGSQISTMIDWYWTWVPPIEDNLMLFIALPAAVIVAGLLVYMLVKRAVSGGRKVPRTIPSLSLSLFLFGILALVLIMLWDPINSALQSSKVGVAGAFFGLLVVGVLVMFMGQRMNAKATA